MSEDAPHYRTPRRSDLHIADLKARTPVRSLLMNVKVPADLFDAITRMARQLDANKTEVTVALLTAGLDQWKKRHAR